MLFVPIGYECKGSYEDKDLVLFLRVKWMGILRVIVEYVKKHLSYRVKIFFFTLMASDKNQKEEKPEEQPHQDEKETSAQVVTLENVEDADIAETTENAENTERVESTDSVEPTDSMEPTQTTETTGDSDSATVKQEEPQKKKWKLLHFSEYYAIFLRKSIDFWGNLTHRVVVLMRKKDVLVDFIQDERNQEFFLYVLHLLKNLIKKILPRKHRGYLRLGLADPSLTGEIYGGYTVLTSLLSWNVVMVPEFEEEVVEAKWDVKGHIQLIWFVVIFIRLAVNPNVHRYIRMYRRRKKN